MKHSLLPAKDVSRETSSRLIQIYNQNLTLFRQYRDLLLWWNRKVNLVSRSADQSLIDMHVRHSLLPYVLDLMPDQIPVIDTGTGGGLPGIPLAIHNHHRRFILNDVSSRKCTVLKQIIKQLQLSNTFVNTSDLARLQIREPCFLVSKYTFKLTDFLLKSEHLPWQGAILYKGEDYLKEWNHMPDGYIIQPYRLENLDDTEFFTGKYLLYIQPE